MPFPPGAFFVFVLKALGDAGAVLAFSFFLYYYENKFKGLWKTPLWWAFRASCVFRLDSCKNADFQLVVREEI